MEITKTIDVINTGDLNISNEITVDFLNQIIIVGAEFMDENSSCEATFEEIMVELTGTEMASINKFFNKARRIAINRKIQPDVDLTDGNFIDELS